MVYCLHRVGQVAAASCDHATISETCPLIHVFLIILFIFVHGVLYVPAICKTRTESMIARCVYLRLEDMS